MGRAATRSPPARRFRGLPPSIPPRLSALERVAENGAGQWLAVHGYIDDGGINFWLGHQGYEYVDLGRLWQIYLFVGLVPWVVLMLRSLRVLCILVKRLFRA